MVVDEKGEFVTQRELPRMALIQPSFKLGQLVLRAPGMLALHLSLEAAEWQVKVRVWDDVVEAWDMGDIAAQWFSDFLGVDAPADLKRLRLVRFDPEGSWSGWPTALSVSRRHVSRAAPIRTVRRSGSRRPHAARSG